MVVRMLSLAVLGSTLGLGAVALAAPDEPQTPDEPVAEAPAFAEVRYPDGFEADQRAIFDEPVDDAFGMGEVVEINAQVVDNAFVMGRTMTVAAPIGGDLFAMGETITIDSVVDGDVWAMGADVIIAPTGEVRGDVHGLAGTVDVSGPIRGNLNAGAGRVELAAVIDGSVNAEVGEFVVEDGGQIVGDLSYRAPEATDGLDAIVGGTVEFTEQVEGEGLDIDLESFEAEPPSTLERAGSWVGMRLWDYLSKFLVGVVLIAIGGTAMANVMSAAREKPAESLGVGFLTLILVPVVSFLCIVTFVPMTLGFLGLLALFVGMYVGQLVTAYWLGDTVLRAANPESLPSPYAALAVGLIPVVVLFGVPYLSFLAVLLASLVGLGAIVNRVRSLRRAPAGIDAP